MLKLNREYVEKFIDDIEFYHFQKKAEKIYLSKMNSGENMSGWIDYPLHFDIGEICSYIDDVKKDDTILVVIGIGGSYLGASAAIQMLNPQDADKVYFIGPTMDTDYLYKIIKECEKHDCLINVISKSGSTFETSFYFDIFKNMLQHKYGEEFNKHICCTTGDHGVLFDEAQIDNYKIFNIPDNIGGRYSVLTAVGLLPMYFSGIRIGEILYGAKSCNRDLMGFCNEAYEYAIMRNILYKHGYDVELFVSYKESFNLFNEWLKQLFGESEGKENKGIFPSSAIFSRDLHSLGQFLQEGKKHIFETSLHVLNENKIDSEYVDYYKIKNINNSIVNGAAQAHSEGDTPVLIIEVDNVDDYHLGYMFYFFETACAMSAYLFDVNPFNQPGVELYKKYMKNWLKS